MTVALQEANLLFEFASDVDGSQLSTLAPTFLTKADDADLRLPGLCRPFLISFTPETTGERPADLADRLNFRRGIRSISCPRSGSI